MALIKCPECTREVSDKAMQCPNCGCPISLDSSKKSLNATSGKTTENQQETPTIKRNGKKRLLLLGIAVVACALITGGLILIMNQNSDDYLRGMRWGMTRKQIIAKDNAKNVEDDDGDLVYITSDNDGLEGIDCFTRFKFDDKTNGLVSASLTVKDRYALSTKLVLDVIKLYEQKYGDYELSDFTYSWETERSNISMIYIDGGNEKLFGVIFEER